MIETFFARASSSARLLEPPLGSYLESLAQTLQGQSYSREVIRNYVHAAGRASEITGLSWQQVRFGTTTYLDLNGKGRKERSVPETNFSQPDAFYLAQCNLVFSSVVKFGCSRGLVSRHLLGVLEPSVVL
jgi:hypothetical protein